MKKEILLFLHKKNFKLFPIRENGKQALFKGWQDWAKNADEKTLLDFLKNNPSCNWGVYCGPSELLVLDVDCKQTNDGFKNGFETLDALTAKYSQLPKTLTIETATGSRHFYFKGQGPSTVAALGAGLDTRGIGGYVVAPGSNINNKPYKVIINAPIAPLPDWLRKELSEKQKEKKILSDKVLILEGERNKTLASLAGSMRSRGMDKEAIEAALQIVNKKQIQNPVTEKEVEIIAESISKYEPEHAQIASDFLTPTKLKAITADEINPDEIKPRNWIMKNRYVGNNISVLIAPGGVGKSNLTFLDAVSIVTGKPLTGFDVANPGPVWLYNTEDPLEELQRRMAALSKYHNIPLNELKDFHISSGRDTPIIIAKNAQNGILINQNVIDDTSNYILQNNIKLLIIDPFVRSHEVSENDNMQMDKVTWCFQRIAEKTGCAICLVHHTRKPSPREDSGDMNQARGASSLINAARIAHTLNTMTKEEAKKFSIPASKRGWYIRLDNAKANLQAPAERADWFEKASVELGNGDSVGTLVRRDMLVRQEFEGSKEELKKLTEREELAAYLDKLFETGEEIISVTDLFYKTLSTFAYPHLFNLAERSRARFTDFVISELKNEIAVGDRIFKYSLFGEQKIAKGRAAKHFAICEEIDENNLGI